MLLRIIGPPGTLTIMALQRMLVPAVVSLAWATIGAALTWLSIRRQSRTLWSLGALLMAAAAVKLVLLDFGSLRQLNNILALMAAGGVFLMVAWVAPFPPEASRTFVPLDDDCPDGGRGWLWIGCPLGIAVLSWLWTQN